MEKEEWGVKGDREGGGGGEVRRECGGVLRVKNF